MKIAGDWMTHPGTVALCTALEAAGFQALFVGGCVRNAVIGQPVSDIDLATDARPEIVTDIGEKAGMKVVPTGLAHGTVTVVAEERPHEVTTFRRDVETNGRHAVIAFSDRIEEDAARRDFTMNALYADIRGRVLDPLNGLPDLLARRVRFVGDAEARIREDYLRILRFFRFYAQYGDAEQGLDTEGLAACAANTAGIETLSKERIWAEIRKLLLAPDPGPAIGAMAQTGVMAAVLPGADSRLLAPFLHLSAENGLDANAVVRLAALGGENVERNLRLSRAEARHLFRLQEAVRSEMGAGELGYRLGAKDGAAAWVLRKAALGQPVDSLAAIRRGAEARFPVRAADLPDLQGAALGQRLKDLEARWIDSGFTLGKDELLG